MRFRSIKPSNVLLAGLAAFFFFLATLNYRYSDYSGGPPLHFPIFSMILMGVSFILLAAIRLLSRDKKILLAIVIVSILVASFGAEIFIKYERMPLGQKTKLQVIDELTAKGIPRVIPLAVYGQFESSIGRVQPLAGLSHSTAVSCDESGKWEIAQLDRHGFNGNPDDLWDSTLDIAAVGASDVFGLCAPPEKTIFANIRNVYPRTLNLGYIGSGPIAFLRRMYEYLPQRKPKLVLFFYNDYLLYVMSRENLSAYGFTLTLDPGQIGLIYIQHEIDEAIVKEIKLETEKARPRWQSQLREIVLLSSIRRSETWKEPAKIGISNTILIPTQFGNPDIPPTDLAKVPWASDEMINRYQLVLRRAKEFVDQWNGRIILVYLPLFNIKQSPNLFVAQGNALHERIVRAAKTIGLDVIDLKRAVEDYPDPFSLFPPNTGGHYNEKGQKFIADQIMAALKEKQLSNFLVSGRGKPVE